MERKLDVDHSSSKESSFRHVDTVLTQFYNYWNDGSVRTNTLGNPGLGLEPMTFRISDFGFSSGEDVFRFTSNSNQRYIYKTNVPFARISYISGPKKYQDFDVFFTESLNSRFNFSITYNTQGSIGTYINQETKSNSFSIQNSFRTRSNNYGYFVHFKVNSGSAFENGGIKSDSVYGKLTKLSPFDVDNNKLKVQVWQEGAVNRFDNRELFVSQFYRFRGADSCDLANSGLFLVLENTGFVDDFWFEDQVSDSLYFGNFGISIPDSSLVVDKSHWIGIKNNGFLKYRFDNIDLELIAGLNFNVYRNTNYVRETNLTESSVHFGMKGLRFKSVVFNADYVQGVDGFNSGGYLFDGGVSFPFLDEKILLKGGFSSMKSLPSYKFLNYSGSNINWNNDFDFVNTNSLNFELNSDSFGLYFEGKAYNISNYVYYSSAVIPEQFSEAFSGIELSIIKKIVLGSFHFDFSVLYQSVTDGAPVNLANWIWKGSVYHQKYVFKDAMELRYGLDYWQNSKNTANYYAPFTRSFIYQENYSVGNFPYMNVFFSARIKSAQGFVNFQNVGQLFFRENYMMVPFYPLQDFGISFGLRWDFFN